MTPTNKTPKIENARDRSLWRFNLDELGSTGGVASSGSPSGRPSSFRWLSRPRGCAELRTLDFRRLLSTPARPVANSPSRIGVVSYGSTGCVPPACAGCSALPTDRWRSFSTCVERSLLRQGRDQPPTRIGAVLWLGWLNLRLAPAAAPAPRLAQPPICTGCFTIRLYRP